MLEILFNSIRWLICKLIFKDHCYKKIYDGTYMKTYKCRMCGKEYNTETVLGAKIWKQQN